MRVRWDRANGLGSSEIGRHTGKLKPLPKPRAAQVTAAAVIDIRRAVEQLFEVKVDSVRVINMRGKRKRNRNMQGYGHRPSWRKAYVKLKPGQKTIEYFEGA